MTSANERQAPHDGPVTLINVFEVPVEQVEAFVEQWRVRAQIMADAPGFRDTRLHRAVSPQARFQLVNVAHWDSQAQLNAAQNNRAFQDRLRALRADPELRFTANPVVYEVVAGFGGQ